MAQIIVPRLQDSHATSYDRYPCIFEACQRAMPNPSNVLSFGCSTGEEMLCLKEKYWPNTCIWGGDSDVVTLETCRSNISKYDPDLWCSIPEEIGSIEFDIVLALAVLCKWPDTKDLENCNDVITFKDFEDGLTWLNLRVAPGGLLAIANTNFNFEDSEISLKYEPIECEPFSERVNRFDKHGNVTLQRSAAIWRRTKG